MGCHSSAMTRAMTRHPPKILVRKPWLAPAGESGVNPQQSLRLATGSTLHGLNAISPEVHPCAPARLDPQTAATLR